MNTFSSDELKRYSRHFTLSEIGPEGQQRLKSARVLIVGTGGLGSPAALYLAAAGVGTLGIVDCDRVDSSNLQRQVLHSTPRIGTPKVQSAKNRVRELNPHVAVETHELRLNSENALDLLARYDIIIDGSDNFPTRYLINDACVLLKRPNVSGSVLRFEGQVTVFDATQGCCYRCLYPHPPLPELVQNCADTGVLGVLPGIIGTIQAAETVKLIVGLGKTLVDRLLLFDALKMQFREIELKKNPECPACGTNPTISGLIDYEAFCGTQSEASRKNASIDVDELRQRLDRGEDIFILDVREPEEYQIANIGGHLIPVNDLPRRIQELDPEREIVVLCHHGIRSAVAAEFLQQRGFSNVKNLEGGIDAWAAKIDQNLVRY